MRFKRDTRAMATAPGAGSAVPRGLRWALVGATLAGVAAYSIVSALHGWFSTASPATCLSTHCFCEAVRGGLVKQPSNAWSSIGFAASGAAALGALPAMLAGTRERRLVIPIAVIVIATGISSFVYHATLTRTGQFFDIFTMYLFATALGLGALHRRGTLKWSTAIWIFLALNTVAGVLQWEYPDARRFLFAGLLLPAIVLEARVGQSRWLWTGLGLLVVAYVVWVLDETRIWCTPGSLIQGHALWHLLTAIACGCLLWHYSRTPSDAGAALTP